MASFNKVILVGNLGQDPTSRKVNSGNTVTTVSIATNDGYTNKEKQKVDVVNWHNLEFWGELAVIVEQYLKKGSQIMVEGKLTNESWEDNGVKKYKTKIVVSKMQMLGKVSTSTKDGQEAEKELDTMNSQMPTNSTDDLPF